MSTHVLRFDGFELDERRRELRRDGQRIPVKPQVLELIAYLVSHRDRTVSKQELLDRIWTGLSVSDGAVGNAIYEARLALDDDGGRQRTIRTLHKRGFRFVGDVQEGPMTEAMVVQRPKASIPFVGRESLLADLHGGLRRVEEGEGRLVLLHGEAGIGKTSTVTHFASQAGTARVLFARCYEGPGAPPFWPWTQILREWVSQADRCTLELQVGPVASAVAQLVPRLADKLGISPPIPSLGSAEARFQLFDSVWYFLRNLCETEPLVLIIDDLHWADPASLRLLEFVADDMAHSKLMVIGTYREEEIGEDHPLGQSIGDISRHSHYSSEGIPGLDEVESRELVRALSGLEPTQAILDKVFEKSEGNPFFTKEIVSLLQSSPDGMSARGLVVPRAIKEVIGGRVAAQSKNLQRVLSVACVIGRDFDLELLERAWPGPEPLPSGWIDEGIRAHLLSRDSLRPGRLRFRHALIQESLYDLLSHEWRIDLHRRVGEAIEAVHGPAPTAAYLAHHAFEAAAAGDEVRVIDFSIQAAEQAMEILAYEDAAQHYERAAHALESRRRPSERERLGEVLLALGQAQTYAGSSKAARESFSQAAALARLQKDATQLAMAGLGFAGPGSEVGLIEGWEFDRESQQFGINLLEDALSVLPNEDSILRARLLAHLSRTLPPSNMKLRRRQLSQEALQMAQRLNDPATLAEVVGVRRDVLWGPENLKDRLAMASEIVRLSEHTGDRELALKGRAWRLVDLLEIGDVGRVQAEMEVCGRLAHELRQPRYLYIVAVLRATLALLDGRFTETEQLARSALELGRRIHNGPERVVFLIQMVALRREQGRLDEIERGVGAALAAMPGNRAAQAMLCYVYAETGKLDAAREVFEMAAANDFQDLPRDRIWIASATTFAMAAARLGDRDRGEILYSQLLPYAGRNVVVADGMLSYGAVSHQLGILAALLERWDESEKHFENALETNRRLGLRAFISQTYVEYASMLVARRDAGDFARADGLLERASSIGEVFGMRALSERVRDLRLDLERCA